MSEYGYKGEEVTLEELLECLNRDDKHPELGEIKSKSWGGGKTIYRGDEQDGLYEEYYSNGQLLERSNYKDGQLDGTYEAWHENGQPFQRTNFVKGECDGVYEEFYENGQLKFRCHSKHGYRDGLSEEWFPNGQLNVRLHAKEGVLDGTMEIWSADGELLRSEGYKDGQRHGYCNGPMQEDSPYFWEHSNYVNGKRNGLCEFFSMDKDLLARINYVDGKKQGLSEEWNKKGEFLVYKFYNNNRCVAKGDKALERAEAEKRGQVVGDKKTINAPKGKGKGKGHKT